MAAKQLPEAKVILSLKGEPVIREESVSEIFAFRGVGKSAFLASLIGCVTNGKPFLGFESTGGHRVLLVDGELPERVIQKRFKKFCGPTHGQLFIRHTGKTPDGMPPLLDPSAQAEFHERVDTLKPDIIIFDTRTALFRYDTNDTRETMAVNQFLIGLRKKGFAVILAHHAGKNGMQRGRTDNDDNLDLTIKLEKPKQSPTHRLEFKVLFEKNRHGDILENFHAIYTAAGWERLEKADSPEMQEEQAREVAKERARTIKAGLNPGSRAKRSRTSSKLKAWARTSGPRLTTG